MKGASVSRCAFRLLHENHFFPDRITSLAGIFDSREVSLWEPKMLTAMVGVSNLTNRISGSRAIILCELMEIIIALKPMGSRVRSNT